MKRIWTFTSKTDIVDTLQKVVDEIDGGALRLDTMDLHGVMEGIEQFIVDEAEADDDND